ncbi:MAG: response regulator [Rubrivivax sp.]
MARLNAEAFDLLLLDLEMPEMDGFALLEALRADERLREVPVIVTSSLEGVAQVVHRAGRRRLPAQAREPGAAEGARRLEPWRRSACATSAGGSSNVSPPAPWRRTSSAAASRSAAGASARACSSPTSAASTLVESQPAEETIELLNSWYTLMFDAIGGQGGVINQMIGDGLMAIFSAPAPLADAPLAAARAALDMMEMVEALQCRARGGRQGADRHRHRHRQRRRDRRLHRHAAARYYTCVGDTVNLAARLEAHTKACRPASAGGRGDRCARAGGAAGDTAHRRRGAARQGAGGAGARAGAGAALTTGESRRSIP